jgi:pyridoxamine 5'-phosphate oxidase
MDLYHLRESYSNEPLDENSVHPNPFDQFKHWFDEALNAELPEPNAMILSTVDFDNKPQSRAVLLKGLEKENFIFFTNYNSQKGVEIENNPNVSLNFLWLELERQIRINGKATKINSEASDEYFYSRPIGSQIGAHVSNQSKAIANRQILEDKLVERTLFFENKPIKRPENWGGYKVDPISIEFWKGRPNRLHDRILYKKDKNNNWQITRLSP